MTYPCESCHFFPKDKKQSAFNEVKVGHSLLFPSDIFTMQNIRDYLKTCGIYIERLLTTYPWTEFDISDEALLLLST